MNDASSWVACLPAADAAALGELRLLPGLEMGVVADVVWLRGPEGNDALDLALRKVPGLRRFGLIGQGRLVAPGHRVPEGRLPPIRWQPLREALPVSLPAAVPHAATVRPLSLQIVRSGSEQPANALLTDIATWRDFAVAAPEIRLRPLRFAAARDGRVWVEGLPIPSTAGRRYSVQGGVALPCGFAVSPVIPAEVIRRLFNLAEGDVAVASAVGGWEIIKAEQFMPASRSAARSTAEALGV